MVTRRLTSCARSLYTLGYKPGGTAIARNDDVPIQHDRGMMVSTTAFNDGRIEAWDAVVRLGDTDGSAAHPYVLRLHGSTPVQRNLSDAVHAVCDVHGRIPGMAEDALARAVQPQALAWLEDAAAGFAAERTYLAQLTAAVGPLPSTPGQAETEAALAGVRRALEMLAGSDRGGCASGAIAALLYDWAAIRQVLDAAAARFEIDIPAPIFPTPEACAAIVPKLGGTPSSDRAIAFGAQQLYAQHRGLWSLLEARASARGDL